MLSQRPAPDALEDDADEQKQPYDGQTGDSLISPKQLFTLTPKHFRLVYSCSVVLKKND